jgi:hypothetical protein
VQPGLVQKDLQLESAEVARLSAIIVFGLLGVGAGIWFRWIRLLIHRRFGPTTFWSHVHRFGGRVISADAEEFAAIYIQLLRELLVYLARNLGLLIIGLLPAAIVLVVLSLYPSYPYGGDIQLVSLSGTHNDLVYADIVRPSAAMDPETSGPTSTIESGQVIVPADLTPEIEKIAYCDTAIKGLLYSLMVFDHRPLGLGRETTDCVVQRPYVYHRNWLWPVIDDIELSFLTLMLLASLLLPVGRRVPDARTS